MEFTADLIAVQGLLTSASKSIGEFTNFKFKGGNEEKILFIIKEVERFMYSKSYLKKGKINIKFEKNVQNIVFYLIINTEFDNYSYKDNVELSHLVGTVPQLSKCILVHIIVELGLSKVCPKILNSTPPKVIYEIVNELIDCLKCAQLDQGLQPTVDFLKVIIFQLSIMENNKQNEELLDKLSDAGKVLANKLTGINPHIIQGCKAEKIYYYMGLTIVELLRLLVICNERNPNLFSLIDGIILTTTSIFKAVSVNIFCLWAETTYEGQPLQITVAYECYRTIEKYKTYKPANELLQMLSSISRKPKTLSETILESDTKTMIENIKNTESNPHIQKQWFTALLNTNVFSSAEATKCLKKFSYLCSADDVSHILNMSMNHTDPDIIKIVLKCAQNQNEHNLNMIMTRFFYQYGITSHFKVENIKEELTKLLNNLQREQRGILKEIQMFLLQDPQETLQILIKECLNKSVYVECLKETFRCIKPIARIEMLWMKIFMDNFKNSKPTWENLECYVKFIDILIELEYMTVLEFYDEILIPAINNDINKEVYNDLLVLLRLLNDIKHNGKNENIISTLLKLLQKTRCKFLEFDYVKQECTKEIVKILGNIGTHNRVPVNSIETENLDKVNLYYLDVLSGTNQDLLNYVFPDMHNLQCGEVVGRIVQLLPQCVEGEWISVFFTLKSYYGIEKAAEILTDFLLLLCQLVDKTKKAIKGLEYCITHYGITMKKFLFSEDNLEAEKVGTKNICRLLKFIPDDIKEQEGLKLTTILTDRSLLQLVNDEAFVYSVAAIGNAKISQVIAKRMLT